jgi:hypothetical protein
MDALLVLAIYVIPFIVLGIVAKRWFDRKDVGLSDVQAEGDPNRARRPRFCWGSGATSAGIEF